MYTLIAFGAGVILGAFVLHLFLLKKEESLFDRAKTLAKNRQQYEEQAIKLSEEKRALKERLDALAAEIEAKERRLAEAEAQSNSRISHEVEVQQEKLRRMRDDIAHERDVFAKRVIAYDELVHENDLLKRDLQNVDVELNKLRLDVELQDQRQTAYSKRAEELASEYLDDTRKSISRLLRPDNYVASKDKLIKAISWCRQIGFIIPDQQEQQLTGALKAEYEMVVRAAVEREEQARIRAQMREEEKIRRELEREQEQADREKAAIAKALADAMAKATDQHSVEIAALQAKLAEAESRSQRAISMAQQTKAGNVYVISNIGSFGEGIFKIGMTRRLEPFDRIAELGDASVPFPFDVHMMIACSDAPALENALHREFHKLRINKTNPRKEFFKVVLEDIIRVVKDCNGEVEYTADAEALQYRQSLAMSDEDSQFIEEAFEHAEAKLDSGIATED